MKKLATKILKQQKPSAKNLVVAQNRYYARQNKATFAKSENVATENPHTTYPVAAVFGSTGFIGKAVVHELSQAGYQVITPYRGDDFRPMSLKVMGDVGQIVPMRWDPKREDTVLDICSRANIVVNCVGRDYPNYVMDDSWEYSNVTTASIISKACKDTYVERMIHLSCLGADIEHPSKYLRLKAMSELKVKEFFPEATIVRPAQAYGPTDRWLNFIGRSLHPTKVMGVPTVLQAQQKVQPVFVGNVADAMVAILSYVGTKGLVYELGGPKVYKLSEIIKFVADHINQRYTVTSLPVPLAKIVAIYNEMRRITPTFTMDYVDRLQYDSVVSENALTFKDLRIDPIPFEEGSTDTLRKFWRPPLYLIKNVYD